MQRILYNSISGRLKSIKLHVICWSVFITYEVSVAGILSGHFSPFFKYLFFYIINILIFYIHSMYVMRIGFRNSVISIWKLPLLLILELTIYVLLFLVIENLVSSHSLYKLTLNWIFVVAAVWRGVYFMLYGTGYFFLMNFIEKESKKHQEEIEIEKLKNQLLVTQRDFLRAQINPHLLFNSLNFIKYAAKNNPEDAEEAILTLSNIMSFSLDENNIDSLLLSDELKQIDNMIRLNQLRYGNRLFLNYSVDINDGNIKIVPIVLLTLIENIFKHGHLQLKEYPATIKITTSHHYLKFFSSNLPSGTNLLNTKNHKCGLKNIESRLLAYYPEKYRFSYGQIDKLYVVDLQIDLDNN